MKTKHTEESILRALRACYPMNNVSYRIENAYVFRSDWESDFLIQTKAGYWTEFEIKISKSDFKADQKKAIKHSILENGFYLKQEKQQEHKTRPHKFYYVAPSGLLSSSMVPKYAGLMCVNENGSVEIIKNAPLIHKETLDLTKKLCQKYYYYFENSRRELIWAKRDIENLVSKVEELKKNPVRDIDVPYINQKFNNQ